MRALICIAGLSVCACGYSWVLGPPKASEDLRVRPVVENGPHGLSGHLTDALRNAFADNGFRLTEQDEALLTLSTTLQDLTVTGSPIARVGAVVRAYSVSAKIHLILKDAHARTLWSDTFTMTEDYLDGGGSGSNRILKTEANRQRALRRLARRTAEDVQAPIILILSPKTAT